jgi:hypothetical protein
MKNETQTSRRKIEHLFIFLFFSKQTKCQKAHVENNNNIQKSKARASALGGS